MHKIPEDKRNGPGPDFAKMTPTQLEQAFEEAAANRESNPAPFRSIVAYLRRLKAREEAAASVWRPTDRGKNLARPADATQNRRDYINELIIEARDAFGLDRTRASALMRRTNAVSSPELNDVEKETREMLELHKLKQPLDKGAYLEKGVAMLKGPLSTIFPEAVDALQRGDSLVEAGNKAYGRLQSLNMLDEYDDVREALSHLNDFIKGEVSEELKTVGAGERDLEGSKDLAERLFTLRDRIAYTEAQKEYNDIYGALREIALRVVKVDIDDLSDITPLFVGNTDFVGALRERSVSPNSMMSVKRAAAFIQGIWNRHGADLPQRRERFMQEFSTENVRRNVAVFKKELTGVLEELEDEVLDAEQKQTEEIKHVGEAATEPTKLERRSPMERLASLFGRNEERTDTFLTAERLIRRAREELAESIPDDVQQVILEARESGCRDMTIESLRILEELQSLDHAGGLAPRFFTEYTPGQWGTEKLRGRIEELSRLIGEGDRQAREEVIRELSGIVHKLKGEYEKRLDVLKRESKDSYVVALTQEELHGAERELSRMADVLEPGIAEAFERVSMEEGDRIIAHVVSSLPRGLRKGDIDFAAAPIILAEGLRFLNELAHRQSNLVDNSAIGREMFEKRWGRIWGRFRPLAQQIAQKRSANRVENATARHQAP